MKKPKNRRRRLAELMCQIQKASQHQDLKRKNHLLLQVLREFPCLIKVEIDPDEPKLLLIHGPSFKTGWPIGVHVPGAVAEGLGMLELIQTDLAERLRQNIREF